MGGGDLNMKKSWHPGLIKNRAQVWEDQHSALQERKRIEALKKEIEEERAANELQKLNEANGGAKRQERVEFLYAAPGTGSGMIEDREAYLLGRKRIDDVLGKDSMGQEVGQKISVSSTGGINLRDVAAKVSMDPLLAIRKQEAAQYEALVNKKKAELEMEARKAARKVAREATDHDRHRSSRYNHKHHSSRDDDEDRHRSDKYRSSHREHNSSQRSSRYDRDRNPERSRRSSRRRESASPERHRRRRRSDSSSRSRSVSRDRYQSRTEKARSPPYSKNYRRESRDVHRAPSRFEQEVPRIDKKGSDDDTTRAAKLAEMTSAAAELDNVRAKTLEEARIRDIQESAAEDASRTRELKVGQNSGYVRSMQLSTGLVR